MTVSTEKQPGLKVVGSNV